MQTLSSCALCSIMQCIISDTTIYGQSYAISLHLEVAGPYINFTQQRLVLKVKMSKIKIIRCRQINAFLAQTAINSFFNVYGIFSKSRFSGMRYMNQVVLAYLLAGTVAYRDGRGG